MTHALIGGPYRTPALRVGQSVECARRGLVEITEITPGVRSTDLGAPLSWPRSAQGAVAGTSAVVLTGDLVRAVRTESVVAVVHYWGISRSCVSRMRRALGVERMTAGTTALWSEVGRGRLSSAWARRMARLAK